jgi:hypothetical protein
MDCFTQIKNSTLIVRNQMAKAKGELVNWMMAARKGQLTE